MDSLLKRSSPEFICKSRAAIYLECVEPGPWQAARPVCFLRQTMHELSIMQSALDQVLEKARQAGASRVHAIRLRIGALSGVVPDALQFAFEALADGTPAQRRPIAHRGCPGALLVRRVQP